MTTLTRKTVGVLDGDPLNLAGAEALYVELLAPADPTGGTAPKFGVTDEGTGPDVSGVSWVDGSWVSGSWQTRTRSAVAQSPTVGAAGAVAIASPGHWNLWCLPTGVEGGPVVFCGVIPVEGAA